MDLSHVHPWLLIASAVFVILFLWRIRRPIKQNQFTAEYFKGLNYLLNDEQGKALDIFVKLVESDWEIIDTHFALGKIFRRNGEIDKAIKIHQGLIARPSLPEKYKSKVLLELGFDYLGAGWLDRAEGLFREVLIQDPKSVVACRNLIFIYQQEKDWHKAIEVATDLLSRDKSGTAPMIAHYYCELADLALEKGDEKQLENFSNQALRYDASSVRASLLLGQQCQRHKNYQQAIRHYEQVEEQDADFIPVVLNDLITCYESLNNTDKLIDYLAALVDRQQHIDFIESYALILDRYRGSQSVVDYLSNRIQQHPSINAMQQLLHYYEQQTAGCTTVISDIKHSLESMQMHQSEYKCHHCGFEANTLYWLCPSCNHWSTVKPSVVKKTAGANHD